MDKEFAPHQPLGIIPGHEKLIYPLEIYLDDVRFGKLRKLQKKYRYIPKINQALGDTLLNLESKGEARLFPLNIQASVEPNAVRFEGTKGLTSLEWPEFVAIARKLLIPKGFGRTERDLEKATYYEEVIASLTQGRIISLRLESQRAKYKRGREVFY